MKYKRNSHQVRTEAILDEVPEINEKPNIFEKKP
jgi:hypothetical protein